MSRRKAKSWEDISEENRKKLSDLRHDEVEYLSLSGYNKWKTYFITGSSVYIIAIYIFYVRKLTILQPKTLLISFGPIFPYGLILKHLLFDDRMFKKYYETHHQINRLLRETTKKSEIK